MTKNKPNKNTSKEVIPIVFNLKKELIMSKKNNKKNNKNASIEIIPISADGRFRIPVQFQEYFKVKSLKLSIKKTKNLS